MCDKVPIVDASSIPDNDNEHEAEDDADVENFDPLKILKTKSEHLCTSVGL